MYAIDTFPNVEDIVYYCVASLAGKGAGGINKHGWKRLGGAPLWKTWLLGSFTIGGKFTLFTQI